MENPPPPPRRSFRRHRQSKLYWMAEFIKPRRNMENELVSENSRDDANQVVALSDWNWCVGGE
jgi:hypothetical protein